MGPKVNLFRFEVQVLYAIPNPNLDRQQRPNCSGIEPVVLRLETCMVRLNHFRWAGSPISQLVDGRSTRVLLIKSLRFRLGELPKLWADVAGIDSLGGS